MGRVTVLVAGAVAVPAVRATRWLPFLGAAVVGLGMPAVPAVVAGPLDPGLVLTLLRLAMLCLALGVGFLFDDPARPTTATAPTPAWVPLAARVAVGTALTACWWFATLAVCRAAAGDAAPLIPRGDLTLEAVTVFAVGLAVATFVWRRAARGSVGLASASGFLVVVIAAALLPKRIALLTTLEPTAWAAAHDRWLVTLVVAVATTLVAATWSPRALRRTAAVTAGS